MLSAVLSRGDTSGIPAFWEYPVNAVIILALAGPTISWLLEKPGESISEWSGLYSLWSYTLIFTGTPLFFISLAARREPA